MTVTPALPATDVIKVDALDSEAQVRAGYELDSDVPDEDIEAANCSEPSIAGFSPNTYACNASVFSADACWRHADGDLICLGMPWERTVYRRKIAGDLPETPAPEIAEPLGLQLEDGSRYRLRNGMGVGTPPEGYTNTHDCISGPCGDDPARPLAVVTGVDNPNVVNQDGDVWTVAVGPMAVAGTDAQTLPEPEVQRVVRAWFITAG